MSLSDVVNMSISRSTKVPARASFGTLAFVCYHALNANLVNEVREADEVLDLGATVYHPAYRAAALHFSQEPRPEKMLIVKRQTYTQILHLTPVKLTVGHKYAFTIVDAAGEEHAIEHTVVTGTVDAIVDALVTAITNAAPASLTPTANNVSATHLILTSTAGTIAQLKNLPNPSEMLVYDATIAGTTAADVTTFLSSLFENQAYALAFDRASEAEVMAAAAVIESKRKMLFVDTCDSEAVDGGDADDVGSQLKTLSYARTTAFYSSNACGALQSVGFTGRCLPYDPGSETWAHKTVKGIAADNLLGGQLTALETKRINHYVETGGLSATRWGTVPDGDYIDVIRGVDWLYARMSEAIWRVLYSLPKVPFTDAGIAIIESAIRAVLESAVRVGLIDKGYTVTVPKAAEVDAADKAARTLPDVKFSAVLAGAIHKVRINGNVSL